MSESPEERKPKRQKRDTSYKTKAFEKFKQLKNGAKKKYEVEELESVYETVDEKEYVKRVLDRQDDDWIVDDDGSGYVEDGRDMFDDDLDSGSIAQSTSTRKGTKRKKKAVSENAGKGNLQFMLSNMPSKKKEEVKIDDDDMLSEILGEIDEDKQNVIKPKTTSRGSFTLRKQVAKDYMKSFSVPTKKIPLERSSIITSNIKPVSSARQKTEEKENKTEEKSKEEPLQGKQNIEEDSEEIATEENITIEEDLTEEMFKDDFDMDQIEEAESKVQAKLEQSEVVDMMDDIQNEFDTEWNTIPNDIQNEFAKEWSSLTNEVNDEIDLDKADIPLTVVDNKKVFRFFWWDAYEDREKQKGTVFLFGKTYCDKAKSYVSCCVAVRNINRQLFVLPRPNILNTDGKPSEQPVTYKDLYSEFNEKVMKPLGISSFRTRYVNKKYAFSPEIPTESDYMEVRYPASDRPVDNLKTPKTFSKIFGRNTSFLEILLLERKIKGPCWLDIVDPVPVTNPLSWCKFEVNCLKPLNVHITETAKPLPPPPLVTAAINFRSCINPKTLNNEIVMISCISHTKYAVDKQPPNPPFQQHFCVFCGPSQTMLPLKMYESLQNYKATRVQKMDSEKALLNYFVTQFAKIDPDLIVGHDLQGYQMNLLANRLIKHNNKTFSKMSRLKRSETKKLEKDIFTGRLVCDIKISAKELIKSRSYDLEALCQSVLKINENQRMELEPEDIPRMFQSCEDILKLISFTMQDTSYILRMMYDLNVIPLALQITNIAGNVMSKTLMGGRSERNEFLLLHAFHEKGYIVPDKEFKKKQDVGGQRSAAARKKPTYSGGLVLDPKVGFYDTFILLMDFNSLYPSIIQEYNICFTTLPVTNREEKNAVLPDKNLPPGILPTEIRKLVESRRQVKSLMNNLDVSSELRIQYHIRQMALKLTANSMYGCLGFSNSRFYAKNLAALVTQLGREILTNTRDLVQKMCFEVVYGDTDSLMINTNCQDYEQVHKIGSKVKQEVNKMYKQVELDIDGVFKYLLLLKKKKYAAVTLCKTKDGKLKEEKEYKGLDIVRRDWSQLACEAGKFILEHILSDQASDDRINNIHTHLSKLKEDLQENRVPLQLLVITKQLTKDPKMYTDANSLSHVQVALRYNQQSGGHLRAGDTVPYVICEDGSTKTYTQRAYHVDELKNSKTLKIDTNYYLSQQILPVVTRICEPIEGIDSFQIAETLGVDQSSVKKTKQAVAVREEVNIARPEVKFRNVDKFVFNCLSCKQENTVSDTDKTVFLDKCSNLECKARPIDYLHFIQNQLTLKMRSYIKKFYLNEMTCEDPACTNVTRRLPLRFVGKFPVCTMCGNGVMYRMYSQQQLYTQLSYFWHVFDLGRFSKRPLMEQQVESGYHTLRETVEKYLNSSGYSVLNLTELFKFGMFKKRQEVDTQNENVVKDEEVVEFGEEEDDF